MYIICPSRADINILMKINNIFVELSLCNHKVAFKIDEKTDVPAPYQPSSYAWNKPA
jgi:hypothetical protein